MLRLLVALFLLLAAADNEAGAAINCEDDNAAIADGWVRHSGSCYRWNEGLDYWYPAELSCTRSGGHLASVSTEQENTFIGRLTYCMPTWLGLYGLNADGRSNPANYRWTDGSVSSIRKHNFSRLIGPHQPLVTAESLQWYNNLYHARSSYVCKAPASPLARENLTGEAAGCPAGWHRMADHCYLQPDLKATYIEAGFYCDGRKASLVSVLTERELRLLSLLDLGQPVCSIELWIGLVKLNPCRNDFSDGQAQKICYRWADRSADYLNFPDWEPGHPNGDLVTNCVVLKDRTLRSEPCHMRHSFVCKRRAVATTPLPTSNPPTHPPTANPPTVNPPTHPPTANPSTHPPTANPPTANPSTHPPSDGVQAAYDFRRGVNNLARPGRFRVLNSVLGSPQGAVLNGSNGIQVDTEDSALTKPLNQNAAWTIFYYIKRAADYDEIVVDVSGDKGDPSVTLLESPDTTDLTLYSSAGFFKEESDHRKGSANQQPWVRAAVVFAGGRANFYRNWADVSAQSASTSAHRYPENYSHLVLGNTHVTALPGYRGVIACFGVAHAALSQMELAAAFQRYCP